MTHVSKIAVASKTSVRIKRNLIKAALDGDGLILESLLTPTETLMLAKRLAIIVLLSRGESSYRISRSLKVSDSSVQRFQRMIDAGLFKPILRELKKKRRSILDILELLMSAGMPSIAGPRYQKRLNKLRRGDI